VKKTLNMVPLASIFTHHWPEMHYYWNFSWCLLLHEITRVLVCL